MKLKKCTTNLIQVLFIAVVMINSVFAEDITVVGSIPHTLKQSRADSSSKYGLSNKAEGEKVIQLLKIELSDEKKALLESQSKDALTHRQQFSFTSQNLEYNPIPNKVELGMNNVPVLDQGIHGTCVTFAITGALDAVIKKGDYISQLCNLQLGSYLENHGNGVSGWEGSYPINVINQIEQYGVVNKEKQHKVGCGDLFHYPTNSNHFPGSFIEPEKYSSLSELIFGKAANWSDIFQKNNQVKTLNEVKESLQSGDRVVFAVMLPRTDLGFAGAVGRHNTWIYKDTWLLTPEIVQGVYDIESAHEMIITGYDDDATAVDDKGNKHKGLLILRNSWGSSVGDWGEFYMSYDYFKLLAYDVKRLSPNSI